MSRRDRMVPSMNGVATCAAAVPGFNDMKSCLQTENVRSAAARCVSKRATPSYQIPGNPKPSTKRTREWVCPDCDYFEEAEEEGA